MGKRFRIDFVVRELDVPDEHARGITFGDDVPAEDIPDFFNKCRDAARTLFSTPGPQKPKLEPDRTAQPKTKTSTLQDELKRALFERYEAEGAAFLHGASAEPTRKPLIPFPGDDGSRGGDGPCSEEAEAWYRAQREDDYGRY